ncbi:MAG: S8 family serine peptidase [Chitinophagaceae bacterium]
MDTGADIICPLCGDRVNRLLYRYHIDNEKVVMEKIKSQNPGWAEADGVCSRCVDYYHTEVIRQQRLLPEIGPYFPVRSPDDFVILPTPLRVDADPRFTGKGVTICFVDSGFYPHPDLSAGKNRIKLMLDMTTTAREPDYFLRPHDDAWHGTMTSVVCAGDGFCSNGLYRGIASDAELVLLKVMDESGRITTPNIVKALEWIVQNHERYGIRIVNMSLGDDFTGSYKESEVNKLAEELFEKGISIVAAAGNDQQALVKPPANSPHVIACGGINDENSLDAGLSLYHSSFGVTAEGIMKPELTAHSIWIAAPLLPGTREKEVSETLHRLLQLDDTALSRCSTETIESTGMDRAVFSQQDIPLIRQAIRDRIQAGKYITPSYMHVDGTSFAAPVVSAVIAQLLEINPQLGPRQIRETLFSTAKRLEQFPPERQGFGLIRPRKAILKTLKRTTIMKPQDSPYINRQRKTIEFFVHNDCASQISLAGSFNHWAQDVLLMEPGKEGLWKIEIPMLPCGRYQYKFFVDEKRWIEDYDNPLREPDGFRGFNSILVIEN